MPTAEQIKARVIRQQVEGIDEELSKIEKQLRKYQPLIELRQSLQASRRALLSERSTTANGGGRGLSQAEVVNAMKDGQEHTVAQLAESLSVSEAVVRGHLNRGKDERFTKNGNGSWELRDPETDADEDDDDDE